MTLVLSFLLLFNNIAVASEKAVVSVVDTGLNMEDVRFKPYLCPEGHRDFTGKGLIDRNSHGTHVAGSIIKYAEDSNYCLVIIKYMDTEADEGSFSLRSRRALDYATSIGSVIINFSSGGKFPDPYEFLIIRLVPETLFVVAAGNDSLNLDEQCLYFPACYSLNNIISIGSLTKTGIVAPMSNYGNRVFGWERGEEVLSTMPGGMGYMSGTSMAASVRTGKIIKQRYHK